MSADQKSPPASVTQTPKHREQGIRIFTYPKVIFIFPTLVVAIICSIGMKLSNDDLSDPWKENQQAIAKAKESGQAVDATLTPMAKHQRFVRPQNMFGMLFLGVLAFNLLVMSIDFPRFTVVAGILLVLFALFFILWIGAYFDTDLLQWAKKIFGGIYAVANSGFYFMVTLILTAMFGIIWITRWLDYWEILPNEILHHHGPLSDLERYPTLNLKFDKEIPDVFEYMFLHAGRLVLHVADERKSIVLDNVLFINSKEEGLKKLMSRLEVRVTTDQEVADN